MLPSVVLNSYSLLSKLSCSLHIPYSLFLFFCLLLCFVLYDLLFFAMLTMEQQHFDDARRNIVDRCEQDSWTISQQERQAALAVLFLKFQSLDSNVAMVKSRR